MRTDLCVAIFAWWGRRSGLHQEEVDSKGMTQWTWDRLYMMDLGFEGLLEI